MKEQLLSLNSSIPNSRAFITYPSSLVILHSPLCTLRSSLLFHPSSLSQAERFGLSGDALGDAF
jgi:hypothetical protein